MKVLGDWLLVHSKTGVREQPTKTNPMIKPKTFPKIRIVNLFKTGYTAYWADWKHIKFNLTPKIERFWSGQIINIGWPGIYISLDFRRGNFLDQMKADSIVRQLPKN